MLGKVKHKSIKIIISDRSRPVARIFHRGCEPQEPGPNN